MKMAGAESHHLGGPPVSSVLLQVLQNPERDSPASIKPEPRVPTRRWQRVLLGILQSRYFEGLVAFVILMNLLVMIVEADQNADCDTGSCSESLVRASNLAFTIFYTIELSMRIAAHQLAVVEDKWNILDAFIVACGWLEKVFEQFNISLNWLRLFRLTRLSRASRFPLRRFPELHMLVVGFAKAMVAMFWGSVMILCMLLLWALLVVELVHPYNRDLNHIDDHCAVAYSTVWKAFVTLFQTIVAGDSWGHCSLDVIDDNFLLFVPFALAFVTVQLGTMNLILSVIVDHAAKAREEDQEEKARQQLDHRKAMTEELLAILESVDTDSSGTLTYEEFCEGYVVNSQLRRLVQELKLCEEDFRILFDIMDTQRVGCVSYHGFIEFLQNMTSDQLQQSLLMARLLKKREEAIEGLMERIAENAGLSRLTPSPPASPKTKKRDRPWGDGGTASRRSSAADGAANDTKKTADFSMRVAKCQLQFNDMLAKMGHEFDKILQNISMPGSGGASENFPPPSSARSGSSRHGSKQRHREGSDSDSSSLPRLPKEQGGLSPASSPMHAPNGFGCEDALSDLSEPVGRIKNSTGLAVPSAAADDSWRGTGDPEMETGPVRSDSGHTQGRSCSLNGRHVSDPKKVGAADRRKPGERLRQHL